MKPTSFLKLSLLIISTIIFSACSEVSDQPIARAPDYDPYAMPGMPCHQMGGVWMGDCQFDENGNLIEKQDLTAAPTDSGNFFSQDVSGLPEGKLSQIVELKDGDTYQMSADIVKQIVGNRTIKRLAYNGQIPGPLLKVPQGAKITIEFTNNLDVDTTIHSHGLRLDNAFDGVPDVTQKAVKPGEKFTYQIKFPDAGIYWYHPHIREDYTQELGLYGNMLVEPHDPAYWSRVDREEQWIVDDILLDENMSAFNTDYTDHALMGRFGNTLLLNNEENYTLEVKKGEVIRFYVTNVANTRVFNLGIDGVETKLVGGDIGRIEKEIFQKNFLMAPAERVVFEAKFNKEGSFDIVHKTPEKTYKIGQIIVKGEVDSDISFDQLRNNSADYSALRKEMDELLAKAPDKSLRLSIEMMGMQGGMNMMGVTNNGNGVDFNRMSDGMNMMTEANHVGGIDPEGMNGVEWEDTMAVMNKVSTSENTTWQIVDEQTGKANMNIDDWKFRQGDLVKIRIFNDPNSMHPMQHPVHFHGQRFVVLSRNGLANENLQWKDTTLVRPGETVDILVEMSNPGTWMAHCHIAEHLHTGMMFGFNVE